MKRQLLLDWLRFTIDNPSLNEWFLSEFGLMAESIPATGFYNTAIKLHGGKGECGRIDWHTDHPSQKVCYTFAGKDLDVWRGQNRVDDLIRWAFKSGARFTRLDVALDLLDCPEAQVSDLLAAMRDGKAKTSGKTWSLIEGSKKGRRGFTLYVGSRQSEKFLRVYDKGAEQGVKRSWIRAELECKGDYAQAIAARLEAEGLDFGRAEIKRFADFPMLEWWQSAVKGGSYIKSDVDRTPGNRVDWQDKVLFGMTIDAVEENEHFRARLVAYLLAGGYIDNHQ